MNDIEAQLPIETQFQLAVFDKAVDGMTIDQAKDYLKRANRLYVGMRQMYLKECQRNLPVIGRNESNQRPPTNPF